MVLTFFELSLFFIEGMFSVKMAPKTQSKIITQKKPKVEKKPAKLARVH